jgi:hypothetical protein
VLGLDLNFTNLVYYLFDPIRWPNKFYLLNPDYHYIFMGLINFFSFLILIKFMLARNPIMRIKSIDGSRSIFINLSFTSKFILAQQPSFITQYASPELKKNQLRQQQFAQLTKITTRHRYTGVSVKPGSNRD